eukprot:scaffold276_cov548-Prasinococcus_capsulatus_cf.AAC.16
MACCLLMVFICLSRAAAAMASCSSMTSMNAGIRGSSSSSSSEVSDAWGSFDMVAPPPRVATAAPSLRRAGLGHSNMYPTPRRTRRPGEGSMGRTKG